MITGEWSLLPAGAAPGVLPIPWQLDPVIPGILASSMLFLSISKIRKTGVWHILKRLNREALAHNYQFLADHFSQNQKHWGVVTKRYFAGIRPIWKKY